MENGRLTRDLMAARVAAEFEDGWIVNLGVGIPTLCSNYSIEGKEIVFQSEKGRISQRFAPTTQLRAKRSSSSLGVIGYGGMPPKGQEDLHLVNAGGQYVTLNPGAAIVHHADAFAVIRGGHVDVSVMGSYQVAENGDFANWRVAGRMGGGIGGAMDLAVGAKRVFIMMEHTTRKGEPRLLKELTLPATARGVVKLVMTDLGLFDVTPQGFRLREIAPGFTPDEVQKLTEAHLVIPRDLKEMEV